MNRIRVVTYCALLSVLFTFEVRPAGSGAQVPNKYTDTDSTRIRQAYFSREVIGMHTLSPMKHWPTLFFGSIRPAGVSWGALEPSKGQYDWHGLDSWVSLAEAHSVQFDYLFLNTPVWASTRPNEPCIGGRLGCAAPPKLNDWEDFVRALVTRYKGRIASFELWNEPNASGFWSGTPQQMAELAAHAYPIIKSIDPAAIVIAPSVSSTGWPMAHDLWLDQYLSAGGGKFADVIAWHGYSGRNDRPALPVEDLLGQIQSLRSVLAKYHLSSLPIWDTEGGWGKDAQLPDEEEQASFLVKWYLIQFTSGIARTYWYQWDNPLWGTLWRQETGPTPAGIAAQQVVGWLTDVTAVRTCRLTPASALWTCDLIKHGDLYRAAWTTSGRATFPNMDRVVSFVEVGGLKQFPGGQAIRVSSRPILFQMRDADK